MNGAAPTQKREPDPEAADVDHDAGPYHAERDSALAKCSHFIIYQVDNELAKKSSANFLSLWKI